MILFEISIRKSMRPKLQVGDFEVLHFKSWVQDFVRRQQYVSIMYILLVSLGDLENYLTPNNTPSEN